MPVESATYISQLNPTYPTGAEFKSEGDDHLRLIKSASVATFPNVAGAVTKTHTELNSVTDRALRAGDTYTGTHDFDGATAVLVPTVITGDSSTNAASTAFVSAAIGAVNSQTALVLSVDSGTSVAGAVGTHTVCTNAGTVTFSLPASASAGDRVKVTFTNSLLTNVVSPNGGKIFSSTDNHTANAFRAAVEFVYANASIGWTY